MILLLLSSACSSEPKTEQKEAKENQSEVFDFSSEKTAQWRKDKLSLFVHFGAYSQFEGVWNNQLIEGPAENIWATAGIPPEEYERKIREFDPRKWDANSIVNMARDIGMKRIIFNAKHHDGFCLFKTATTDFNVIEFTPYNQDLVQEMASACKSGKIKLSISFSLCNWHLPAAFPMSANHNTPVTPEHHQTNLMQIEELLSNYGPIAEIYFYSGLNTPQQSREIRQLVKDLQPNCLISDGIGNNMGDFIATDFNILPDQIPGHPWNMLASVFPDSRGYKEHEENIDIIQKARLKVKEMAQVLANGGNYSLSIGPRADGSFGATEEEILKNIGRWIKVNREAIYNVEKSPFQTQTSAYKITRKANKLFLMVDSAPRTTAIRLTGLNNKIKSARFLGSGIEPGFSNRGAVNEVIWTSPAMADPMQMPVIELVFEDTIRMLPRKEININPTDTVTLNADNAIIRTSISQQDRYTAINSTTSIKWNLKAEHPQKAELFFPEVLKNKNITIETADNQYNITLQGKQGHQICSQYDTIQTGDIYQSEAFYGKLEDIHINPNGSNRLRILNSSWKNLKNAKETHLHPLPMSAFYYYAEIESQDEQQYSYRITGNDGLQVWFNQKEIILSRNETPGSPMKKELVFDLKKGKNTLVIKNYNRVGAKDYFDLTPLTDAHWWKQSVSIPANPEFLQILNQDAENPHSDINLPNFSILLTPEPER